MTMATTPATKTKNSVVLNAGLVSVAAARDGAASSPACRPAGAVGAGGTACPPGTEPAGRAALVVTLTSAGRLSPALLAGRYPANVAGNGDSSASRSRRRRPVLDWNAPSAVVP